MGQMNFKELILSTLKGESTETLPFIPRLDLWYSANKINGTLPTKYKNASLRDITDELDLGYHAVIPQFRDFANENDDLDIGLGIYRFRAIPYHVELHNVERKVIRLSTGLTEVEYSTPKGKIKTGVVYDETMRKNGSSLHFTKEHAIKGIQDFDALAYIFENAEVKPDYSYYSEFKTSYIGTRGVAVGFSSSCASPMHYILKELMAIDNFYYTIFDHPEEMEHLAERLSGYCNKIFDITAGSPAEVILSGANYDQSFTPPDFFDKYITPELKKQSDILHSKGKYLLTHTDGENAGLLGLYLKCGFDIADSVCPAPSTSLTLKDTREVFGDKITIWGGLPFSIVLENSMSEYEFEKFLDMTLTSIGCGDHIILSIADTTPPGARFERILRIAERAKQFGPVII
jgi:hypothetical protein